MDIKYKKEGKKIEKQKKNKVTMKNEKEKN